MRYKKKYEMAVIEPEETRRERRPDLQECQRCGERLAGYSIEQPNGDILQVCKRCLLIELTE